MQVLLYPRLLFCPFRAPNPTVNCLTCACIKTSAGPSDAILPIVPVVPYHSKIRPAPILVRALSFDMPTMPNRSILLQPSSVHPVSSWMGARKTFMFLLDNHLLIITIAYVAMVSSPPHKIFPYCTYPKISLMIIPRFLYILKA